MSASCCDHAPDPHLGNEGYRRVLWAVLAINATMFAVEVAAGLVAGSAALQADALDFLGDTANYAISLFVVGMALRYRAMAAFLKGATMGVFGLWVLGVTAWHVWHGLGRGGPWRRWSPTRPRSASYGLTEAVTPICARHGFARATTCSAILRFCLLPASGTGTGWPDVIVAATMAALALQGAWVVLKQSRAELSISPAPTPAK